MFGPYDVFGELGLGSKRSRRTSSVVASTRMEIYTLSKWDVTRRVKPPVLEALSKRCLRDEFASEDDVMAEFRRVCASAWEG